MPTITIQAGHEGRTSGATGAAANGLREIDLTPRIANACTSLLRDAGFDVDRQSAAASPSTCDIAVAFHLDGTPSSGAQLLFDDPTDLPLARYLRDAWSQHYIDWIPDNTTPLVDSTGFARYYGFAHWTTRDGEVVIEMGSIGDPVQAALWRQPGYPEWAGRVIGAALARRLGAAIPDPGAYGLEGAPILAAATASPTQAYGLWQSKYQARSAHDESTVGRIIEAYWTIGPTEEVDPAGGFAQALKETGGFSFLRPDGTPGDVSPGQWNMAGIGAVGGGNPGMTWPTLETGVQGHLRRLRLYATHPDTIRNQHLHDDAILLRPLPATYWGSAGTFQALGGKWAPNPDYGRSIVQHYLTPLAAQPQLPDIPTWAAAAWRWAGETRPPLRSTSTKPGQVVTDERLIVFLHNLWKAAGHG